ncbi:MAG: HEAT repeat domain-containing protein [Candidatus Riflebacteria bacterium]|nr:HEAT repeat domain-containing protein [Candidatus Riflebacteria bacterium]
MQCPGCGFENEGANKFCNMCGMALPSQGDTLHAPMDRAPLELDLSLDIPELPADTGAPAGFDNASDISNQPVGLDLNDFNINTQSKGNAGDDFSGMENLSLDLGSSAHKDTPDFSDNFSQAAPNGFELDLSTPTSGSSDLSFDLNTVPSGLDLNASPSPDVSGFDIQAPATTSTDFDLSLSGESSGTPDFQIDIPSVPEPTPVPLQKTVSKIIPGPVAVAVSRSAAQPPKKAPKQEETFEITQDTAFDMSSASANEFSIDMPGSTGQFEPQAPTVSSEPVYEITPDVGTSDSMSFDFGDLDVNSAAPLTKSASKDVFVQTQEEDDIVQQFTQKAVSSSPASENKSSRQSPEPEQVSDSFTSHSAYESYTEPVAKEPAAEVDEDLAGLIMGIEGKTQPAKQSHRAEAADIASQGDETQTSHHYGKGDLEGFEAPDGAPSPDTFGGFEPGSEEISSDSGADISASQEPAPAPESKPLTPEEQLQQIKSRLALSVDPDDRYSLVLAMAELKLPGANPEFIKLLTDDVKDIREIAAENLGEAECKEAVRPLLAALASGDSSLKFIAARSLGSIRDESAVASLIKLLEEDNDDLRYVALEALGKIGAGSALKAVAAFLKSRNHDLRFIACEAIGNIREPNSVNLLLPMLKDPDFEVRIKAIEALGKIGSTAACDQLLVVLGEDNERIRLATIQALGQIKNPNAVDAMVDIFQVSNPQIKEKIVWAFGEIGSEKAVEPLLSMSQAFTSKLTFLAIEAFAKIKSAKAGRFVLSMLDRNDIPLRLKAIEALGEIAEKTTAGNLVPFLDGGEPILKISAARALGKIGNPVAIEPLVGRLTDSERDVRLSAIEALGEIRGAKAIGALINSLREQDPQIIEKTEWALCELQDLAVEPITKALFHEPTEVVPSLVRVLGRIGSIRAIFPLLKVLDGAAEPIKQFIADSLIAIDKHLTEDNPISVVLKEGYAWAQFSIAQALSSLADERAFPLLIKIARETLTDKDMKKLSGIPDKRILECSGQILQLIRLNVARLFAQVGNDKAIPVIMQYFSEGDLTQRQWCVEALGGIQTEGALDALIDILKKPEFQIPLELLAKQLISSKSRKLVEKLVLSASHPAEPVRVAIAVVLGETRDPRAIRTLSGLVKDTSDKVRSVAIEAVGKIGTTAAVQPAIEALKDSMEAVRAKAAAVLGDLKDTAAVEFLEKTTHDSSESVRGLSIRALAAMADARVPEILIKAMADKAESVRCASVEVLGQRKDRVAIPNLIQSLEDPAESVREKSAVALGHIGDPKAIMPLLTRLDDPSSLVPLACSEAIVSFRIKSYPVLIEALKHDEERIRRHACDLLMRIGEETLVIKLLRMMNDRNNFLRENAARILGKIGDGSVVDQLITMLYDRSSSVRRTTAEALGNLRDIRSIVSLKKAERDQSREVRQAASVALQEIFKAHKLG